MQADSVPYGVESMLMMYDRWRKLLHSFYSKKDATFDISKIPDIYDSAKYDCIHNKHLGLDYTKVCWSVDLVYYIFCLHQNSMTGIAWNRFEHVHRVSSQLLWKRT